MTDNKTTELQSLSKLKKAGKLRYWRGTIEMPESELHAICDEIQAEHDQAITATLGEKPRDRTEEWLLKACNRATQDYVAQLEQEVNELKGKLEVATLGSEPNTNMLPSGLTISDDGTLLNWRGENYVKQSTLGGGTLTAKQVRETIRKYAEDDSCYIFEVYGEMCGPIADELNIVIGGGR